MLNEIRITGDDLLDLLELLAGEAQVLDEKHVAFKAQAQNASHASAGLPELSELVVTIGAAGGFTALATILSSYFQFRPKQTLRISIKDRNRHIELASENSSPEDIEAVLQSLLSTSRM